MKKTQSNLLQGLPLLFGAWTLFALFMLLQSYVYRTKVGQEINLPVLLAGEFAFAYIWLALTPLVLRLADRFRLERPHFLTNLGIHVVAGGLLCGSQVYVRNDL